MEYRRNVSDVEKAVSLLSQRGVAALVMAAEVAGVKLRKQDGDADGEKYGEILNALFGLLARIETAERDE